MTSVTRRRFGRMALASPAMAAAGASKYTGALDGFESKVPIDSFDPVAWTRKRYDEMPLRLTFRAKSRKDAEAWQKKLRAKVIELIGGFPAQRTPLRPQTLETSDFPSYRREKFVIETRPGLAVLGYLLTPKNGKAPFAPMICLPGHGRGVDDVVGIDEEGRDRTNKAGYQHDFAIQAVEHGLAAVAIEQMAFGCRRHAAAKARSLSQASCQPTAGAAMLMGETMVAWRVWDVMRTIDWIETRPDLDKSRVGCMGISGGGTITVFSAALEPRIRVAFSSGYLNTFKDSIFSISHCIDNYVPGILHWAEMYDVAGLIAPQPLFIESGEKDNIFPVAATRESFARVKKVYEMFGAEASLDLEIFPQEHVFHGVRGLPFAAKHLLG